MCGNKLNYLTTTLVYYSFQQITFSQMFSTPLKVTDCYKREFLTILSQPNIAINFF